LTKAVPAPAIIQAEVALLTEMDHRVTFIEHMLELQTKKAGHVPIFVMQQAMQFAYEYVMGRVACLAGDMPTLTLEGAKKPLDQRVTLKDVDDMVADYKYNGKRIKIVDPSKLGGDVVVQCCHCGSTKCRAKKQRTVKDVPILVEGGFVTALSVFQPDKLGAYPVLCADRVDLWIGLVMVRVTQGRRLESI